MKRIVTILFAASVAGSAFSQNPTAVIHTSAGDITVELFADKSPKTVENFIGLATGKKAWTDPRSGATNTGKPLYNDTIFHRTIPGFMIQGGDPLGNGSGGPGFTFADEFSDLKFDGPGLLAMANRGPATNGSQFFITVAPTPHLTNKHTIFGKVTSGMDIVTKIVSAPTGAQDRPVTAIKITGIDISGQEAPKAANAGTTPSDANTSK